MLEVVEVVGVVVVCKITVQGPSKL